MPTHLPHPHVAVPIRDRSICAKRLEADPLQAIDRRDDNRQRGTVQRQEVRAVERMVAGIIFTRAPRVELGLGGRIQRRREGHDRPHVQVGVGPSVQPFANPWRKRVVDRRMAECAGDADAGELTHVVHLALDSHDRIQA